MTIVDRWTGCEAKLLRKALRLSVRDFAERLGVGVRTVNKWEARQGDITPLPHMQEVLDTALARASDEAKARFAYGAQLKRDDEVATAKHEYAASQSESKQADHRVTECLGSEQAATSPVAGADAPGEPGDDGGRDPVLSAPWNHRSTVKVSVALSGSDGGPVERRLFTLLTGAALTIPAHQWLIRDPEPLVSALSGGRVSVALTDQLPTMIATLRTMDDVAGGGTVLALAQQAFGWVAGLLDQASYDERTGRNLYARPGKQRDLDAAADCGLAAVHLAESLASIRGTDCLRDLYMKMQPHASVPAVRDFMEQARGVLAA